MARAAAITAAGAVTLALAVSAGGCGGDGGQDGTTTATATESATTSTSASKATGAVGNGGESEATAEAAADERATIERTVQTVVGGGDPNEVCGSLVTEEYVADAYGDERGCMASARAAGVVDVRVNAIEVEASDATATATPSDGPAAGEKLKVSLVHEGELWKVDSIRSNAPVGP
jgi:hypothetical protein